MNQPSARKILLITSVVFGSAGLFGVMMALMSFMMFDAPGSEKTPATIALFLSVFTFPITCAMSILLAWIFYALKKFRVACGLAFLPVLNVVSGAAALTWLEIFNGGNFS